VTAYNEIEALPTEWLWAGRIPSGEVTLVAGQGGSGKGLLAVDLAARVSRGLPMPFTEDASEPQNVVLITPEDDTAETVSWRLRAAGADLSRVHDLTLTEHGSPFVLSADATHDGSIAQLREAVDELGARLVVNDPLMATIAYGTISTNLGARRVMALLQRLAKETGCSVLMSHHLVKSGKVGGSQGLVDAARILYRVHRDKENPAIRVMSIEKSNVLGDVDDVRYLLAGEGHDTRVVWLSRDELEARRTAWRTPAGTQALIDAAPTSREKVRLMAAALRNGRQ
jgi:putative DNA primase/helicase